MKTAPRTALVASCLAALTLSACSASATDDDAGSSTGEPITVEYLYDTAEIDVPENGELTVVAPGRSDAEVALALGVEPAGIYDWMWMGEENHGVGPWAQDLLEGEPTYLGAAGEDYDYELIQSLAPDLILDVHSDHDEATWSRLNEIAPNVSGPVGATPWQTGWREQVQQIAQALGVPEDGEALIEDVESQIAQAAEEHPEFEELSAVAASKVAESYGLHIGTDMRWALLEGLGFSLHEPAEALAEGAEGYLVDVSEEQVDAFDADAAVFFASGFTLEELQNDPLLSSLDTVQENRAVFIDPDSELAQAISAGNVLSLPVVIEELPARLAEAVQ
ncbi:ABC transporter substrate-binding protein [Nesterenkonia flava]|uniref:ABC transporter substrate-binding protein n=1 Tax=Nesterenkonia flava TaxID=469799 RepID=A0ABU1FUU3_9MICC|nr:ABC transporter substrate-binding protein [Nesterenkonia flava]MDR5711926.1 ABC transporter substrate-binding protein [Nesterenkonia flava]